MGKEQGPTEPTLEVKTIQSIPTKVTDGLGVLILRKIKDALEPPIATRADVVLGKLMNPPIRVGEQMSLGTDNHISQVGQVEKIEQQGNKYIITTKNSVYTFKPAESMPFPDRLSSG